MLSPISEMMPSSRYQTSLTYSTCKLSLFSTKWNITYKFTINCNFLPDAPLATFLVNQLFIYFFFWIVLGFNVMSVCNRFFLNFCRIKIQFYSSTTACNVNFWSCSNFVRIQACISKSLLEINPCTKMTNLNWSGDNSSLNFSLPFVVYRNLECFGMLVRISSLQQSTKNWYYLEGSHKGLCMTWHSHGFKQQ